MTSQCEMKQRCQIIILFFVQRTVNLLVLKRTFLYIFNDSVAQKSNRTAIGSRTPQMFKWSNVKYHLNAAKCCHTENNQIY